MATTTHTMLDAALALGKQLYVLILRLALDAARGQDRHRLQSSVGTLLMRLADASVCRSRRQVRSLLESALPYAQRMDVLLAGFEDLGVLHGEDRARGATARQRIADLRALLERLLGPMPDLHLVPEEEPASSRPPSPPPPPASEHENVDLGTREDAALIAGRVGEPWSQEEGDIPDVGSCVEAPVWGGAFSHRATVARAGGSLGLRIR